jgi:hypothetical protein
MVAGALRRRVTGKVLERRDNAVVFEPADVRGAELRDQIGILAQRLLDPG